MPLMKPRDHRHSREHEYNQNEQRGFSAAEQRRPVLTRSLRGKIVDELSDAPQDQQQRPEAPDVVPKPKIRIEPRK